MHDVYDFLLLFEFITKFYVKIVYNFFFFMYFNSDLLFIFHLEAIKIINVSETSISLVIRLKKNKKTWSPLFVSVTSFSGTTGVQFSDVSRYFSLFLCVCCKFNDLELAWRSSQFSRLTCHHFGFIHPVPRVIPTSWGFALGTFTITRSLRQVISLQWWTTRVRRLPDPYRQPYHTDAEGKGRKETWY